jgi:uncharacterized Zn-binding protein involved in type VI secretion
MSYINRLTDVNTASAAVTSTGQTFATVAGQYIATNGDPVAGHGIPPHASPVTANGLSWFTISGIPVNVNGNADSCGHTRNSSVSWFDVN